MYALQDRLPIGLLKNHDGNWVEANTKTVTTAAANAAASMPSDFRVSITDAPGADSYPISSFTYLLIYEQQNDVTKDKALAAFIEWDASRWTNVCDPSFIRAAPRTGDRCRGKATQDDQTLHALIERL